MSEKKRKRHSELPVDRPNKKLAQESRSKAINVSINEDGDEWRPVLASTPGLHLPPQISLKPYTKARPSASRQSVPGPELLLHSSAHPKLDWTAREETSNGVESHLKHYVGVYDSEKGTLQLVEARKLVIRSTLRSSGVSTNTEAQNDGPNYLSARNSLGLAFGTKKSQKAIRSLTANAIKASPSKSSSKDQTKTTLDPIASAVVSSMAASTSSMPTREEMQVDIDEAKPCPRPHLDAETPAEVYPVEELAGGVIILQAMGVKDWIDKIKAGQDVQTKSKFVARRLKAIAESGDVKQLKTLRYLLLLVEWYKSLHPPNKQGRRIPKLEEIPDLVTGWGSDIVNSLARRFADGSIVNKWHHDNLTTHILALTLVLDNFSTDSHDIREDLKLETKDISKYFAELGCTVALPTEAERTALNLKKVEAGMHRIAKLRLPLVFPKMRVPAARKKR